MSLPILQTKLYIPRQQPKGNVVPRPHLAEMLNAGLAGRVTLVSAPAGFGKSTLLGEWIAELRTQGREGDLVATPAIDHQIAWLTLDGDDNDPVRFLMYLIASLRRFDPTVGDGAWPLLLSPQPTALKTILTLLLNDLSLLAEEENRPHPCYVLVLEDYHLITAQPIHEALTYLIDHLPPHLHVIITTRADPPLPLPRWRARGQLAEIRAAELRFTPDEAAAFLNDRMGLCLSTEEVMALEVRTEGWIAGLQLVAISLQGRENKADFVQSFSGSNRFVLTYLVEEVLNQQPVAVQTFLLRTSILDRLCGPLCDAVVDGSDAAAQSQALLERLHQANIFLVPLDDEGEWYRYHHLFAEVLQHRLQQTIAEAMPELHSRASAWYAQQELLTDAIHHALSAGDFAHTADLIEQSWQATWNQGAIATLLAWVQALPRETLIARPDLAISYAWALALAGKIEEAESCLHQVEAALRAVALETSATPLDQDMLFGRIAALRSLMAARRGEPSNAVQLAQDALRLIPEGATLLRGNACYALGLAYQQHGSLIEALNAYQDATRLGVAADEYFLTVAARYHEGRIWMAQGQLRMAATTYQQLLADVAQNEILAPVVGLAHIGYAEILYQWNDLAAAALQVETGLALSPSGGLTYTDGPLHRFLTLARIRHALNDDEGALVAVRLATERARQTRIVLDVERAAALAALIHLRRGELEAASRWANGSPYSVQDDQYFEYGHEFELSVFVRYLLAQTRTAEAIGVLARWLAVAEGAQRTGSMIEIRMLQAQALQLDGQPEAASETLLQALALAEPEGYIRLFVDEGQPLRRLLATCRLQTNPDASEGRLLAYIDTLLAAFDQPVSPAASHLSTTEELPIGIAHAAIANLVDPLTAREVEVLHLITAGLSNAAIAEQLVVSIGTVKSHLKHIYGKLAVESRTQAVAQARTLGLL
ncbi:MAG: LuxR C-terminal-related transcriptional regulator [Caldilinea sp.]